jgi:hypothetical protein
MCDSDTSDTDAERTRRAVPVFPGGYDYRVAGSVQQHATTLLLGSGAL